MQWQFWGSSPLARGARVSCAGIPVTERLIPARAGNTTGQWFQCQSSSAHPRSRGEHLISSVNLRDFPGSSPLARGTPESRRKRLRRTRLIPARAGNTHCGHGESSQRSAHPRSRGEHPLQNLLKMLIIGSSPLARGTHSRAKNHAGLLRLIPARAGNTGVGCPDSDSLEAHPRSRGEHTSIGLMGAVPPGSSPLARGTLTFTCRQQHRARLIPARAGNTLSCP